MAGYRKTFPFGKSNLSVRRPGALTVPKISRAPRPETDDMSDEEFDRLVDVNALPGEQWRPIPTYDGWYEASSLGRIRRNRPHHANPRGVHVLAPKVHWKGYLQVQLCKDGRARSFKVHVLVAAAFHGAPPSDAPHIDHIDGDKTNNRPINLEYVSNLENQRRRRSLEQRLADARRLIARGTKLCAAVAS